MAFASPRVFRVEHGLSLLPNLEERWRLDLYRGLSSKWTVMERIP